MPEHRGHRLGLGLKVATHRRLAEARSAAALAGHLELAREPVDDPGQREALGYELLFHEVVMQGRRAGWAEHACPARLTPSPCSAP